MRADGGIRPGPWMRRLRSACADPRAAFRELCEEQPDLSPWPMLVACSVGWALLAVAEGRFSLALALCFLGAPLTLCGLAILTTATWGGGCLGDDAPWSGIFRCHLWALAPSAAASLLALVSFAGPLLVGVSVRAVVIRWLLGAGAVASLALCVVLLADAMRSTLLAAAAGVSASAGALLGLAWLAWLVRSLRARWHDPFDVVFVAFLAGIALTVLALGGLRALRAGKPA